jgi:hypothetical protein
MVGNFRMSKWRKFPMLMLKWSILAIVAVDRLKALAMAWMLYWKRLLRMTMHAASRGKTGILAKVLFERLSLIAVEAQHLTFFCYRALRASSI